MSERTPTSKGNHMQIERRFKSLLTKRIGAERNVDPTAMTVVEIKSFPMNKWGHTGSIEVVYNAAGHHALYGFDSLARVSIYAD